MTSAPVQQTHNSIAKQPKQGDITNVLTTVRKAFGYLRVSTPGQVNGDGFDRQEHAIRTHAASQGLAISGLFYERGVSGDVETMDRPSFVEMLAGLTPNDVVIVEKLDRLSRQLLVQETCIQDLQRQGYTLLSADPAESDLMASDPGRVLVRQVFGAIHQYEKSMIVAKLRAARHRTGRTGGQSRFGVRAGETEAIARLVALRSEGFTYERIADIANAEKIQNRRGKWHGMTVKRILCKVT